MKAVPKGNYVIIKGNKADANADFLRSGMTEAGIPKDAASATGDIKIVGEDYTDNWKPAIAQTHMEQFLTAEQQQGRRRSLRERRHGRRRHRGAQGPGPRRQGRRCPARTATGAALNNVALGNQTVDVWKDARELGKAAGEAAVQLCEDQDVDQGRRHRAVHDPRRQHRELDHHRAASDHQGQPATSSSTPGGSPRTLCAGRPRRTASPPASSDAFEPRSSMRPAPRFRRGAGRFLFLEPATEARRWLRPILGTTTVHAGTAAAVADVDVPGARGRSAAARPDPRHAHHLDRPSTSCPAACS